VPLTLDTKRKTLLFRALSSVNENEKNPTKIGPPASG